MIPRSAPGPLLAAPQGAVDPSAFAARSPEPLDRPPDSPIATDSAEKTSRRGGLLHRQKPPPRRLRLSTILTELVAESQPIEAGGDAAVATASAEAPEEAAITPPAESSAAAATDADEAPPTGRRGKRRLREKLHRPRKRHRVRVRSNITIGEIIARTRHAGFGFLVALIGLLACMPYISMIFGLVIAFLGGQMLVGLNQPWVPRRVREHAVAMTTLSWINANLVRWTSWLEKFIKPRWTMLSRGPFWPLLGVGILLQGIGLALPFPIPGSNWVFVIPILFYSVGLLEDDGLLILLAHLVTATFIVLGISFYKWFAQLLVEVFTRAAAWFG